MKKFFDEFKEFISRGSVMDLAVGVIMGSAFTAIVTSLVDNIITPLLGIILNGVNFSELSVQVGDATIKYGMFIQSVINFLLISLVIFCMVKALNTARNKLNRKKEAEAQEEAAADPQVVLLEEIRDLLAKETSSNAADVKDTTVIK